MTSSMARRAPQSAARHNVQHMSCLQLTRKDAVRMSGQALAAQLPVMLGLRRVREALELGALLCTLNSAIQATASLHC